MMRSCVAAAAAITVLAGLGAGTTWAAGPFDGVYRGTSTRTVGPDSFCPKDFRVAETVADGKFEYVWDRRDNAVLIISVGADGTLSGSRGFARNGDVVATGTITNGALEADLTGKICTRHLSLKRSAP